MSQNRVLSSGQAKSLKELVALDGTWCASSTDVGSFIERYIVVEAIARRLITLNSGKPCPHTLYLQSIHAAAHSFESSLNISPILIEEIFRSGNARAGKFSTPRQLRNQLIHGLSAKATSEVEFEHRKLMDLMQRWLDIF